MPSLRLLRSLSFLLLCAAVAFAPGAALASLDARPLVAADLAELGGSDFDGGVGDLLLRNDEVWAVILKPGGTTGDFGIPLTRRPA
jgi:hypothetical protein